MMKRFIEPSSYRNDEARCFDLQSMDSSTNICSVVGGNTAPVGAVGTPGAGRDPQLYRRQDSCPLRVPADLPSASGPFRYRLLEIRGSLLRHSYIEGSVLEPAQRHNPQ